MSGAVLKIDRPFFGKRRSAMQKIAMLRWANLRKFCCAHLSERGQFPTGAKSMMMMSISIRMNWNLSTLVTISEKLKTNHRTLRPLMEPFLRILWDPRLDSAPERRGPVRVPVGCHASNFHERSIYCKVTPNENRKVVGKFCCDFDFWLRRAIQSRTARDWDCSSEQVKGGYRPLTCPDIVCKTSPSMLSPNLCPVHGILIEQHQYAHSWQITLVECDEENS
jgi:hypothetical protein